MDNKTYWFRGLNSPTSHRPQCAPWYLASWEVSRQDWLNVEKEKGGELGSQLRLASSHHCWLYGESCQILSIIIWSRHPDHVVRPLSWSSRASKLFPTVCREHHVIRWQHSSARWNILFFRSNQCISLTLTEKCSLCFSHTQLFFLPCWNEAKAIIVVISSLQGGKDRPTTAIIMWDICT